MWLSWLSPLKRMPTPGLVKISALTYDSKQLQRPVYAAAKWKMKYKYFIISHPDTKSSKTTNNLIFSVQPHWKVSVHEPPF